MENELNLVSYLNPFTHDKTALTIPVCGNLIDTIDKSGLKFPAGVNATILINGFMIPREEWEFTFPKPGDKITLKLIPQGGGGGKNIMRIVMTLALVAGTWGVAGAGLGAWEGIGTGIAGSLGLTGSAAAWTAFGVNTCLTYAGILLIDKIAPLPSTATSRSSDETPKTFGIESSTNQINQWGAVPVLLGKHRFHPPYAAQPYSEIVGDDQYVNMLFCIGYAPIYIEDMKIGSTDIDDIVEDEVEVDDTSRNVEFWVHENFDSNNSTLNYFKNDIYEDSTSTELTYNNSIIQTTQPNTDEIIVDITAPNGVYGFTSSGSKTEQTVQFKIEYKLNSANNNAWVGGPSAISVSANNFAIPLPSNAFVVDPDADHASETKEVEGFSYTRIGIDKTNGSWWTANSGNNSYSLAVKARKRCPNFPGYIAPICGISRSSLVSSMNNNSVDDFRTDELNCGNNTTEFVPSASGNNAHITAGNITPEQEITAASSATIRRGYRFKFPSSNTWNVKITRITEDHNATDDSIYDTIYWTALRSINSNQTAVNMDGLCLIEVRIKASEQFNSQLDNFSVLATSVCQDYDTVAKTWSERPTANPAALFRYILQGPFNKRPRTDASINLTDLAVWYEYCVSKGFGFNLYCLYQTSIFEMLVNIAAAGRSSPTNRDGKYTIITDKEQTTPVQHFTPRTSWNFSSTKTFYESPHGFRITMADETQDYYTEEAFVYDDGYNNTNATLFEELKLIGCTNFDQAWKHGRFHLAQLRLRPETFKINADIENLVCTRGDLVRVAHDGPMWGLGTGRVKTLITSGNNITGITVDETCSMNNNNASYATRFRLNNGTTLYAPINTSVGNQTTLNFTTPIPANNGPGVGDLFMFGSANNESVECLVKSIKPTTDLCAEIELMDYSPAVYTAENGTIPPYDTHISTPLSDIAPIIYSVRSDERVMIKRGNIWSPRILVNFKPRSSDRLSDISYMEGSYKVAYAKTNWLNIPQITKDVASIYIDNVEQGVTYWLRFRYRYRDGHVGPWCATYTHEVVGKAGKPSDAFFDDANCSFKANRIIFAINGITDFDLDFYEIRTDTNFGDSDYDSHIISQSSSLRVIYTGLIDINATYYLKARDTLGNYSVNYDTITAGVDYTSDTLNIGAITADFSTIDCQLSWDAVDYQKLKFYYVRAYNNSSMNNSTELIYSSNQFVDPHFTFDFWTNNNASGGPYRTVWFRVYAEDCYNRTDYSDVSATNPEPAQITDAYALAGLGMLTVGCSPLLGDVVGYQFACDTDNPPSNNQEVQTNSASFYGLSANTTYYYRARARDMFGYSNNWSAVGNATPESLTINEMSLDIPITNGANWNADSGKITWDTHTLSYKGNTYNMAAGNAGANIFLYWNAAAGNAYNNANTMGLAGDVWLMCYRNGNNAYPAFQQRIIHGGLVQANTMHANRIMTGTLYIGNIVGSTGTLSFTSTGNLSFAGRNFTVSAGNFTVSSGNFIVSADNGIYLNSSNGLRVEAGSGVFLGGNATTPGVLRVYQSGLSGAYIQLAGIGGNNYTFSTSAGNNGSLYFADSGNVFRSIYAFARNDILIYSHGNMQINGGDTFYIHASGNDLRIDGNKSNNSTTNILGFFTGSYSGNDNNNRIISTSDRKPSTIMITEESSSDGGAVYSFWWFNNQTFAHGGSQMFWSNTMIGISGNNFVVRLGDSGWGPNRNGYNYHYIAYY